MNCLTLNELFNDPFKCVLQRRENKKLNYQNIHNIYVPMYMSKNKSRSIIHKFQ